MQGKRAKKGEPVAAWLERACERGRDILREDHSDPQPVIQYDTPKGLSGPKVLKAMNELFLTPKQVGVLLRCVENCNRRIESKDRDYGLIYISYNLGLRVGEASLLDRDTFRDIDRGVAHIKTLKQSSRINLKCFNCGRINSVSRKRAGQKFLCIKCNSLNKLPACFKQKYELPPEITIPILEKEVRDFIKKYMDNLPKNQKLFFIVHPGTAEAERPLCRRHISRIFSSYLIPAHLSNRYSFHALRHGRGVNLWEISKDLQFVKEMMRHKSIGSTQKYLHTDPEKMKQFGEALSAKVQKIHKSMVNDEEKDTTWDERPESAIFAD